MIFVANLRPPTIQAFEKHQIQPSAYLLSTHRATPSMVRHAHAIREAGLPLFADNGTKALIEDVIEKYKQAARPIAVEVRRIRRQIGRTPRGKSVPADLRRQASDLAHTVVQECTARSEQIDWKALLDQQIAMNATHIIAHGRIFSGDLWDDGIAVTKIADGSKADWQGPFGDPQTNQNAVTPERGVQLVPIREMAEKDAK